MNSFAALLLAMAAAVVLQHEGSMVRLVNVGNALEYCYVSLYEGPGDRVYLRPGDTSRWYFTDNVRAWSCYDE